MSWIEDALQKTLAADGGEVARMNAALRLLAKHRSLLIQNELIKTSGTDVIGGPFKGMHYVAQAAEGCFIPKLLGCYEQELHPFIATIGERGYATILNIGSAEGYYAIGFKRLFPDLRVIARDSNPAAQEACIALASRNGVAVETGGVFTHSDFAALDGRTLVWCDIEGAEQDLLDPARAPALAAMDIVVELHPGPSMPDVTQVPARFRDTHEIGIVEQRIGRADLPPMFRKLGHLDQLLAIWEWRATPTPWAIMLARSPAG
jgi:hypothetical protein